ncbi:3-dehydroquinate synthase [Peribacillus cavernae]|uniref:3-dehydroquinate synthase n=1 Tax=Peribacillus cavernae TaxID=1674310 RepID=A0A3S0VZ67_9BACI|nr:3-dehydroquinate synthase [Peribacillus cavernae]MDQ0218985.1 3-dehydroquinate synthase [Peribacillus cavernae]RUQ29309.1 3-dehydroquinate synthase [Peribacillus cavernae]
METIEIKTPSKSYPVFIGRNTVRSLTDFIIGHYRLTGKIMIITDEKVAGLHLHTVKESLSQTNIPICEYIVPEGEHAKSFDVFYQCQSFALSENLNRKSVIIALGGGAVGDVAGFVAATFMRGIPFLQIPTTLLAHDSAVGGKVAINHPQGKNMIGVFYQPEAVFFDLDFLRTLPPKEWRSGFAEVVKEALIQDSDFYNWLLSSIGNLNDLTEEKLMHMIKRGIEIKAAIVAEDEKETGVRAYLNLGHTLGHAIEGLLGYGSISHGEAVMTGTIFALHLSQRRLGLDFDMQRFISWIHTLGYETTIDRDDKKSELLSFMKRDKKNVSNIITFVLLQKVGHPQMEDIPDSEILDSLSLMYSGK